MEGKCPTFIRYSSTIVRWFVSASDLFSLFIARRQTRCSYKLSARVAVDSTRWRYVSTRTTIRYDTIRDAILTCARKPTYVSLIYRTQALSARLETLQLFRQRSGEIRVASHSTGASDSWIRRKHLRLSTNIPQLRNI